MVFEPNFMAFKRLMMNKIEPNKAPSNRQKHKTLAKVESSQQQRAQSSQRHEKEIAGTQKENSTATEQDMPSLEQEKRK